MSKIKVAAKSQKQGKCLCGGEINSQKTRNVNGYRIAAFPSHPCNTCGLLHWEDNNVPVQFHSSDSDFVTLAFLSSRGEYSLREFSEKEFTTRYRVS